MKSKNLPPLSVINSVFLEFSIYFLPCEGIFYSTELNYKSFVQLQKVFTINFMSEAMKTTKPTDIQKIRRRNNSIHLGKQIDRLLPKNAGDYGNKLELLKELGFNSYQRYDYNVGQKDLSTGTLRKVANGLGIEMYLLFIPPGKRKKVKKAVWNIENSITVSEGAVGNTLAGKSNTVQMGTDQDCLKENERLNQQINDMRLTISQKDATIFALLNKNP